MTDAEIRAIELYNRSAAVQGFTNAPWWSELSDTLREQWIKEAVRRMQPLPKDSSR